MKMTRTLALIMIVLLLVMTSGIYLTAGTVRAESTLTVKGGYLEIEVILGEKLVHIMEVSTGSDSPTVEVTAQAAGFGSLPGGGWSMEEEVEDTSPYSAREFITQITPSTFTLEPGGSQEVEACIQIPDTFADAARYAMIHFVTEQVGQQGSADMQAAIDVPVILKGSGAETSIEGEITGVTVGGIESGEPIDIYTTFENTGNFHYRAKNEVVISDSLGNEMGRSTSILTSLGIIPSYVVEMSTFHNLSSPGEKVPPGTYQIESAVMLEDGTVLDTTTGSFAIEEPYEAMPGIDKTRVHEFQFTDEEPGTYKCDSADVVLSFEGTGEATGKVFVGAYSETPQTGIALSASSEEGGTDQTPVKFIDIYVTGLDGGMATIEMCYTDSELGDIEETSLSLSMWSGEEWVPLSNQKVFTGANYITGEVQVRALTGTVIALGGQVPASEGDSATADDNDATDNSNATDDSTATITLWVLLAIIGAVVLIIITMFIMRRRKRITSS